MTVDADEEARERDYIEISDLALAHAALSVVRMMTGRESNGQDAIWEVKQGLTYLIGLGTYMTPERLAQPDGDDDDGI